MELNPPVLVHWIDFDLLSRLGIAALLGLALGLDRELRGQAAGLRTHGLICFAAAAMTVSMISLYHQLGSEPGATGVVGRRVSGARSAGCSDSQPSVPDRAPCPCHSTSPELTSSSSIPGR